MFVYRNGLRKCAAVLVLLSGLAAAGLFGAGSAPGPNPARARLTNRVEITVSGMEADALTTLADNESVALVGGKPRQPGDADRAYVELPPAGAVVNLRTRAIQRFTNGHTVRIQSAAISADGSRLFTVSSAQDPFVGVWDIKAGKPLTRIPLPVKEEDSSSYEVASCPGSRRIAVSLGWCLVVLDPDRPDEEGEQWFPYPDLLHGLCLSRDGKCFAYTTLAGQVAVKELDTRKDLCVPSLLPLGGDYHDWLLGKPVFTPDGKRLFVARFPVGDAPEVPWGMAEERVPAERRGLFLIDVDKRQVIPLGLGHAVTTGDLALHPSGDWLATTGRCWGPKGPPDVVAELRLYHVPSWSLALRVTFDPHGASPGHIQFTPDGKRLVGVDGGFDGGRATVMAWDFVPAGR